MSQTPSLRRRLLVALAGAMLLFWAMSAAARAESKVATVIGTYPALSGTCRITVSAMGESVFSESLGYEREVVFVVKVAGVLA